MSIMQDKPAITESISRWRESMREFCLTVYSDLEKFTQQLGGEEQATKRSDILFLVEDAFLGRGRRTPFTPERLPSAGLDNTALPFFHGVLRETLSMIIRGDIPDCSEDVFKLLLEAFWSCAVKNGPTGPSRHNDMYDIYTELKARQRTGECPAALASTGLEYAFSRMIPNDAEALGIPASNKLWEGISNCFLDMCLEQNETGWKNFGESGARLLRGLEKSQFGVLQQIFREELENDVPGIYGMYAVLLAFTALSGGWEAATGLAFFNESNMKFRLLESMESTSSSDGSDDDYVLDPLALYTVLRLSAEPAFPAAFSPAESEAMIKICLMAHADPVLVSSGKLSIGEFFDLLEGRDRFSITRAEDRFFQSLPLTPRWDDIMEQFFELLSADLKGRASSTTALKEHGKLLNSQLIDWWLRRPEGAVRELRGPATEEVLDKSPAGREYLRTYLSTGINYVSEATEKLEREVSF